MAAGTAIYDIFYLIKEPPIPTEVVLDLPEENIHCCNDFYLFPLAHTSTDQYKNDVSGFIHWFSSVITAAEFTLWKDGVQIEVLDDNDFGTFYPYKFKTNSDDQNFIEYQLNWHDVYLAHGVGQYVVRCTVTTAISGLGGFIESPIFCLNLYTPERANGTVVLEYNVTGVMGLSSDDEKVVDFEEHSFYNSYRLPGWLLGIPKSQYTQSDVTLNTGQELWVENEQTPEYTLQLLPLPQFIHEILRTDFMQADSRMITDYNNMNTSNVIKKKLKPVTGYEPEIGARTLQNKLTPVEVKFKQEFNNLKKLRS